MKQALTIDQAAARVGVHRNTFYRYLKLGVVPGARFGRTWRIDAETLESRLRHPNTDPDKQDCR